MKKILQWLLGVFQTFIPNALSDVDSMVKASKHNKILMAIFDVNKDGVINEKDWEHIKKNSKLGNKHATIGAVIGGLWAAWWLWTNIISHLF